MTGGGGTKDGDNVSVTGTTSSEVIVEVHREQPKQPQRTSSTSSIRKGHRHRHRQDDQPHNNNNNNDDGPRGEDSNGTAQSHSQQSIQANNNNNNSNSGNVSNNNNNTTSNGHSCRNNWWNCCCCCCSCISIKHNSEKNSGSTADKVQLPSIESIDDNEQPPTLEEIRSWAESFDKLMKCKYGRKVFRDFLKCEYSEENILFWLACEDLKKQSDPELIEEKARLIYEDFISILSPREVSLDSRVREIINKNMIEPTPHTFDEAQLQIYTLMHRDSYPRFINSPAYRTLAQLPTTTTNTTNTTTTTTSAAAGATSRKGSATT